MNSAGARNSFLPPFGVVAAGVCFFSESSRVVPLFGEDINSFIDRKIRLLF